MNFFKPAVAFLIIYLFVTVKPAHAYLDPGTGSYILQMVLAGVLGGLYIFKGYVARVFNFIRSMFTKVDKEKDAESK